MGSIYRSKAPLRISFGGGGTDVPPYPQERGGVALNVTINRYAYSTLIPTQEPTTEIVSLDYDVVVKYDIAQELRYNGELDLVKAVIRNFFPKERKQGLKLFLHSDAPPGSGLGSSSTMAVSLVGAFSRWLNLSKSAYDIAGRAFEIEREDLGIDGGYQDQYAAAFGGFNFMEFYGDKTVVNPLRIDDEVINELGYSLLLCYTGGTRLSANIIRDQTMGFVNRKVDVVEALDQTKAIALKMKDALLLGNLNEFGELLHEAWLHKKRFSSKITSSDIDTLYEAARGEGAIGGKLLGAGGGGYLLIFCEFTNRANVAKALEMKGGKMVDFGFDLGGLQTWEVKSQ